MAKWTTLKFITAFFENTLGRKRVHGTYRVLEGDHCKLLVRATTSHGTPAGNELIALDLSDDNNKLMFWRDGYRRNFTYRMSRHLDDGTGSHQALPELILTGSEDNLLHSGIVDISPTHALIEIGDKPFLLHRDTESNKVSYTHANQVPNRVASIREAQDKVKDPVEDRKLCQEWWAKEMAFGFNPPEFDPELVKVLQTALNPIDYGFDIDECSIGTVSGSGYGSDTLRAFVPKKKIIEATPLSLRVQRWKAAAVKWSDAANQMTNRKPPVYKGLSVQTRRYTSLANDEDRSGTIIITAEGVYVTGHVHSKADWKQSEALTKWYKLTQHANQINIARCS